jgi:putative DNA primase/helicase
MTGIFTRLNTLARAIRRAVISTTAPLLDLFQPAAPGHDPVAAKDAHIRELLLRLCGNDEVHQLWVMRWIAFMLLNPGVRMPTALVVHGEEGSGKNLIFEAVVGKLFEPFSTTVYGHNLLSRAPLLKDMRYVVADMPISYRDLAWIKNAITSDLVVFDKRAKPMTVSRNSMNFVFLTSGSTWLAPFTNNRRFCIVEAIPRAAKGLHMAVAYEIGNGGIEAFRDYLLHELDMGDFNKSTPLPARRQRTAA